MFEVNFASLAIAIAPNLRRWRRCESRRERRWLLLCFLLCSSAEVRCRY